LAGFLSGFSETVITVLVALLPLVFLPFVTQVTEFPKQICLLICVPLAAIALVASWMATGVISWRRSAANIAVILLLVSAAASAFVSGAKYAGLVGDYGNEYQALATTVLFVLLYFIIVNLPDRIGFVKRAIFYMVAVGGVISLYSLLNYAGPGFPLYIPSNFNFVGSTIILGLYAAGVAVLSAGYLFLETGGNFSHFKQVTAALSGVCAFILAAATGFWLVWAALIAGSFIFIVVAIIRPKEYFHAGRLVMPMILLVASVLMFSAKISLPFRAPVEIFPSTKTTLAVVGNALAAGPVFGTGPGTFADDYALWRGPELNGGPFWNVYFDRGSTQLLTVAATTGFAGLVVWLALILVGFWKAVAGLFAGKARPGTDRKAALAVFAGWTVSALAVLFYSASLTSLFVFWVLFSLLIRLVSGSAAPPRPSSASRPALATAVGLIVLVIVTLAGWYMFATRLAGDLVFTRAAGRDPAKESETMIAELKSAQTLNPFSDLIARNLAEGYLYQIDAVAAKTDLDASTRESKILALTDGALAAGRAAVADSGSSAQNWAELGSVYEKIAPYVTNASDESIKAYARATELDPASVEYLADLGKAYLALADSVTAAVGSSATDDEKATAKKNADDALASAERELQSALARKSDYAPAGFALALVLEREGKTADAISELEKVRALAPTDVGVAMELGADYYRANDLDKAEAELERAIAIMPSFANARWYLSEIYEKEGKLDEAIGQLNEILKTDPSNADAKKRLADIEAKKTSAATPAPAVQGVDKTKK
jgi:tetratricopeptide (TPR) repeat protein